MLFSTFYPRIFCTLIHISVPLDYQFLSAFNGEIVRHFGVNGIRLKIS